MSANDNRPTSVRGSRCGTRRSSCPAAMAAAVSSTSASGRRLRRTTAYPTTPSTNSTAAPIPICDQISARTVDRTSDRSIATVVSSPRIPRTVIARHWTLESPIEPIVTGTGPTSLSAGSAGSAARSLTAIQMRPSGPMTAYVEVRRRPGRVGSVHRHGHRRQPPRGLRPAAGRIEQRLVDPADQAVPQDRGDRNPGRQQAAGHQHQGRGHQANPQRHASSRRITGVRAGRTRRRAACAAGAYRRCRSCAAGTRRRTRRR